MLWVDSLRERLNALSLSLSLSLCAARTETRAAV